MTDITELAQRMKAAAEKASNGDWIKESGDGWEACCSANDQANGGFIIAHFEGPDAAENREFVQAANPANIRALVEALEKAQSRDVIQSAKDYHFDQQADRIAELDAELEREREKSRRVMSRIAELESKLANPVQLPKTNGYWTEQEKAYEEAITLAKRQVRLAGFTVEDM